MDNLNGYIAAIQGITPTFWQKSQATTGASSYNLLSISPGCPGAIASPGSAAGSALSGATPGALPMPALTTGQNLYLTYFNWWTSQSGVGTLADLLVMTSSLSGTSVSTQTVNSTALPRHTTGEGVELAVVIHTQIGATSRTLSIDYTDQAGNPQTTSVSVGGTGFRDPGVIIPVPLIGSGIRSVDDCILSASTGTAGDFGFILYKKIADLNVVNLLGAAKNFTDLGLPILYTEGGSSPCLGLIWTASVSATLWHQGSVGFGVA